MTNTGAGYQQWREAVAVCTADTLPAWSLAGTYRGGAILTQAEAVEERRNIAAGYERGVQQLHEEAVAAEALRVTYVVDDSTGEYGGTWWRRVGLAEAAQDLYAAVERGKPPWLRPVRRVAVAVVLWWWRVAQGRDHVYQYEHADDVCSRKCPMDVVRDGRVTHYQAEVS